MTHSSSNSNHDLGTSAGSAQSRVFAALDSFRIEVPSWGFANTGTRFGKFVQPAAATTIEEKFADAAQVNNLTGASPTVALHVLWDLPNGVKDIAAVAAKRSLPSIARSILGLSMVLETRKSLNDNLMAQEPLNGSVGTR